MLDTVAATSSMRVFRLQFLPLTDQSRMPFVMNVCLAATAGLVDTFFKLKAFGYLSLLLLV